MFVHVLPHGVVSNHFSLRKIGGRAVQFCLSRSCSQRSTQSPQTTLPSFRMNTSSLKRSQLPQRKPFSRLGSTSDGFILQTPCLPHPPARRSTVALCARLAEPEHVRPALNA